MDAVRVGAIVSGSLYYRGVTDRTLRQMNGVAWRLDRIPAGPEEQDVVESIRLPNDLLMGPLAANSYRYEGGTQFSGQGGLLKQHGSGVAVFPGMGMYAGQHEGGQAHGVGVYTGSAGDQYFGTWDMGVRNGIGTEWSVDGDWFRGEFKEDDFTGLGEVRWADGRVHRGTFVKGTLTVVATTEPHNAAVDKVVAEAVVVYRKAMAARGSSIIAQKQAVDESIRAVVHERKFAQTGGLEAEVYGAEQSAEGAELARIGKAQREAKVAARTTAAHDQLSQAEERVFIARANIKDGYHATKDVVDMYRQAVDATNAHLKKLKQEVRKARNLLNDVRRVHHDEELARRERLTAMEVEVFGEPQHNIAAVADASAGESSDGESTAGEGRPESPVALGRDGPDASSRKSTDAKGRRRAGSAAAARRGAGPDCNPVRRESDATTVPETAPLIGRNVGPTFGATWAPDTMDATTPSFASIGELDTLPERERERKYMPLSNTGRRARARALREAKGLPPPLPASLHHHRARRGDDGSESDAGTPRLSALQKLKRLFGKGPKQPPPVPMFVPPDDEQDASRQNQRRRRFREKVKLKHSSVGRMGDPDTWAPTVGRHRLPPVTNVAPDAPDDASSL